MFALGGEQVSQEIAQRGETSVFVPWLWQRGNISITRHHLFWLRACHNTSFPLVRKSAGVHSARRSLIPPTCSTSWKLRHKDWWPAHRDMSPSHVFRLFSKRLDRNSTQAIVFYFVSRLGKHTIKFYSSSLRQSKFTKLHGRDEKSISNRSDHLLGSRRKSRWSFWVQDSEIRKESQDCDGWFWVSTWLGCSTWLFN